MKNSIIYICACLLLLISCKQEADKSSEVVSVEPEAKALTLEGAWELVSFYNYDDDGITDTIPATETNRQIKMYTATKVMWSRYNAADSTDWFGFGSYTANDSILTEVLDFGSEAMLPVIKEQGEFVFDLHLSENTFSQITIDDEGHPFFAENYKRIEK